MNLDEALAEAKTCYESFNFGDNERLAIKILFECVEHVCKKDWAFIKPFEKIAENLTKEAQ